MVWCSTLFIALLCNQFLIPALSFTVVPAICAKIYFGRLLNLCLVQQHGVKEMALSFGCFNLSKAKLSEGGSGNVNRGSLLKDIFQVAQLVVSIPDRAGLKTPIALESPYPIFKCAVLQSCICF